MKALFFFVLMGIPFVTYAWKISSTLPYTNQDTTDEYIEIMNNSCSDQTLSGSLFDASGKEFSFPNRLYSPFESFRYFRPESKIILNNESESLRIHSISGENLDSVSWSISQKGDPIIFFSGTSDCSSQESTHVLSGSISPELISGTGSDSLLSQSGTLQESSSSGITQPNGESTFTGSNNPSSQEEASFIATGAVLSHTGADSLSQGSGSFIPGTQTGEIQIPEIIQNPIPTPTPIPTPLPSVPLQTSTGSQNSLPSNSSNTSSGNLVNTPSTGVVILPKPVGGSSPSIIPPEKFPFGSGILIQSGLDENYFCKSSDCKVNMIYTASKTEKCQWRMNGELFSQSCNPPGVLVQTFPAKVQLQIQKGFSIAAYSLYIQQKQFLPSSEIQKDTSGISSENFQDSREKAISLEDIQQNSILPSFGIDTLFKDVVDDFEYARIRFQYKIGKNTFSLTGSNIIDCSASCKLQLRAEDLPKKSTFGWWCSSNSLSKKSTLSLSLQQPTECIFRLHKDGTLHEWKFRLLRLGQKDTSENSTLTGVASKISETSLKGFISQGIQNQSISFDDVSLGKKSSPSIQIDSTKEANIKTPDSIITPILALTSSISIVYIGFLVGKFGFGV